MEKYEDLDEMQLDALREIGNIGSGNAATALSEMLKRQVDITVPKIGILDYSDVAESLGGPEQLMVALMFQLHGDVTGMIMFLLKKDFAHLILQELMGIPFPENAELDEMSSSAIQEVGNIMAGSFANAIGEMTGLTIDITVPDLCIDMAGAILSAPAIYYANISDKIICIEDEMSNGTTDAGTHVLMVPEVDSLEKIMESLGLVL